MKKEVIGIDPDLVKSGVAWVNDGKLVDLKPMRFFDLINLINDKKSSARFVLEDVEVNGATYQRPLKEPNRAKRENMMKKIAQNVGQVKTIGRLLKDYLEQSGADYQLVKPLTGHAKQAKRDAKYFNRLTGWEKRSNQDTRDAAMLALHGSKCR